MSERVSDERLKKLASIQARAAAVYAMEFDEDVLAVIEELIERRESDRPDDNEPITAKWWKSQFGSPWYGDLSKSWWIERNDIDSSISMRCEDIRNEAVSELPHIRTRGDLRRLWVALTGKELGS